MRLRRVLSFVETAIRGFGIVVMWGLLPPIILMRAYDIVAKQFYTVPSKLFQILEWDAFFLFVLLTLGFTYLHNGHVRIDIVRDRLSPRTKAWIEIIGFALALTPFCVVIMVYGGKYASISYQQHEPWIVPGADRWVKKAMLPFGAGLLLLAGLLISVRNILFLLGRETSPAPAER